MANQIHHPYSDSVTVHRAVALEVFLAPNWPSPMVPDLALAGTESVVLSGTTLHVDLARGVHLTGMSAWELEHQMKG